MNFHSSHHSFRIRVYSNPTTEYQCIVVNQLVLTQASRWRRVSWPSVFLAEISSRQPFAWIKLVKSPADFGSDLRGFERSVDSNMPTAYSGRRADFLCDCWPVATLFWVFRYATGALTTEAFASKKKKKNQLAWGQGALHILLLFFLFFNLNVCLLFSFSKAAFIMLQITID